MSAKNKNPPETERLERENARLRGDLLTIGTRISHDLRTPLGSILSTGELLREIFHEKDPSAAALTDSIFSSVDELIRLIKCVSLVAKASAGSIPKERVPMGEIVTGMLQRLESRTLKKGAKVTAPDSWPEVEGVPAWLEFVWWNFLANALQHGGLKIQLGRIQEKGEHRFWVSDNGAGVPASTQTRLFQTFDSLHEPGSTRGLGLSLVQRLMELQGGSCGYKANPEGGAFFYFTLPVLET
jgi:K+-sensing histidine kinase KdpD